MLKQKLKRTHSVIERGARARNRTDALAKLVAEKIIEVAKLGKSTRVAFGRTVRF